MKPQLELAVVSADIHVTELLVRAANPQFSGVTSLYVPNRWGPTAAEGLLGFPTEAGDVRLLELGRSPGEPIGGIARLEFRCDDDRGVCRLNVRLEADHRADSCELSFLFEPAAFDRFVQELSGFDEQGRKATLVGRPRPR